MFKFDKNNKKLLPEKVSSLENENIKETFDFQEAIYKSWDEIREKLELSVDTYLLGKEVRPNNEIEARIDLLAYDAENRTLIVIELKRGKVKYHLLQTLYYAALVSEWDSNDVYETLDEDQKSEIGPAVRETNQKIKEVKIVLISENFLPEVIITSDWLCKEYNINITAFNVRTYNLEEKIYLNFEKKYPLDQLSDTYKSKRNIKKKNIKQKKQNWNDWKQKVEYDFGDEAIDWCLKHKEGDPIRRRFTYFVKDHEGFEWISLNFRIKYLLVYMKGKPENIENKIIQYFNENIKFSSWKDGHSFQIENKKDFYKLKKWLGFNN